MVPSGCGCSGHRREETASSPVESVSAQENAQQVSQPDTSHALSGTQVPATSGCGCGHRHHHRNVQRETARAQENSEHSQAAASGQDPAALEGQMCGCGRRRRMGRHAGDTRVIPDDFSQGRPQLGLRGK
ncbi:hypothetical protein ACLHIJ_03355 [Trueperella sp. LYQ141]